MSTVTTSAPAKKHTEFAYTARTTTGGTKRGRLPYSSEEALVARLAADPEIESILDVRATDVRKVSPKARPKAKALVAAARQIALAISVGWDPREAVVLAADEKEGGDPVLTFGLTDIAKSMGEGQRMSEAMAEHPYIFPPLMVSTIAASENSGKTREGVVQAADDLEAEDLLRSKIRKALSYPTVVLVLSTIMFIGMMLFVVPQFAELYKSLSGGKAQLPAITQAVMAVSDQMRWGVPVAGVGGVFGVLWYRRNSREASVRGVVDPLKMKIPILGRLFRKIALLRFCRVYGSLIANGIHPLEGLEITAAAVGNTVLEKAILAAREAKQRGDDWLEPLRAEPVFPGALLKFLAVGEATGKVPVAMSAAAREYDREIDEMTTNMEAIIQPVFLLTIAVMVCIIALAIYMPYFSLGDVVSPY